MRIDIDTAARIKACKGLYSIGDCAKHFGVSKRTVHSIWHGETHRHVREASEAPNVKTSRVHPDIVREDGKTLLARGLSMKEAAVVIGVSPTTLRNHLQDSPMLVVY